MFRRSFKPGGNRGGGRFNRRPKPTASIDISKLINKAVSVPHLEFVPLNTFNEFEINPTVKANIARKGYQKPTQIQDVSIPWILQGRDVVGIANTGTGKTAAFLLPLITKVAKNPLQKVLVLAPTRELANQIFDEFRAFSFGLHLRAVVCVGGVPMGSQIRDVKRNPQFVIATPGRLKDFAMRKLIRLDQFQNVVLDEADRMVDMGFINDMRFLLGLMAKQRHSLFFSATMSPQIHTLVQQFLHDPVTVSVKSRDTSANIDQDVIRIPHGKLKIDALHELLLKKEFDRVLVFGRTKRGVEQIAVLLAARGIRIASIHSNKSQSSRQKALNSFKRGLVQVLAATDVAARGLDIDDVSHVINYDMPATYEDYIHRIGRTGRGHKTGKALTFIT